MSRIGVLAALLMLPALLAGCGGNTLLPPTTELTPDKAPDTGGGAYPSAEDTASTGPERFNPFADPSAKPAGGREVIENPTPADIMARLRTRLIGRHPNARPVPLPSSCRGSMLWIPM